MELVLYSVSMLLAVLVSPFVHEGSHWFIGWLGRSGPSMETVFLIFPNGVEHQYIETMDSAIIRLTGLVIFLWIPVGLLALGLFIIHQTPYHLFLSAVPAFTLIMSSESDALAIRNPEEFRQMAINNELPRNPLFLPNWLFPDLIPRI